MQIIRRHSHTRRSAQLYGWGALALLIAVIVLSFVNRIVASIPLLLFCLFAFHVVKEVILPRAERWITGYLGEKRVLNVLRDLSDNYTAITNFVVPGSERGDIDLILVGPMGILVIEIKTYSGVIVYEHGRWWKRQKNGWKTRLPKSPSGQAKGHRKAIISFLQYARERNTALGNLFVPVIPVLGFVNSDGLEPGSLDIAALRVGELTDFVYNLPPKLSGHEVATVTALFQKGNITSSPNSESSRRE